LMREKANIPEERFDLLRRDTEEYMIELVTDLLRKSVLHDHVNLTKGFEEWKKT